MALALPSISPVPHPPVWEFFRPIVNRYDGAIFTMADFVQPGVVGPEMR